MIMVMVIDDCDSVDDDLSMTLWQHLVSEGTVLVWWAGVAIVHQICKDFTRFTRVQLIISRSALIHNVFNRITLIITRYQLNVNDYHKV